MTELRISEVNINIEFLNSVYKCKGPVDILQRKK